MVSYGDSELNSHNTIISDNEREELLKEIEDVVRAGRKHMEPSRKTGASGLALLLGVNVGALLLVAMAVLFVPGLYDVDEKRLISDIESPTGANAMFRALKQEADKQIQSREETIEDLRYQYLQINNEKESLQRDFERRLSARAAELESELRLSLNSERERLSDSGLAKAIADTRIRELEVRLRAQQEKELAAFRVRLQAEIDERNRSLAEAEIRLSIELKQRTDPLKAEIDRLNALGSAQKRELEMAMIDGSAESASARKESRDAKALAERLQILDKARKAQSDRFNALIKRYAAAPTPSSATVAKASMLELLQAKVDTRALLIAEPAKSSHPGLAERLDLYFLNYENEYRRQGRAAALAEATEIIDSLLARREPRNLHAGDPELKRFMERLQSLIK